MGCAMLNGSIECVTNVDEDRKEFANYQRKNGTESCQPAEVGIWHMMSGSTSCLVCGTLPDKRSVAGISGTTVYEARRVRALIRSLRTGGNEDKVMPTSLLMNQHTTIGQFHQIGAGLYYENRCVYRVESHGHCHRRTGDRRRTRKSRASRSAGSQPSAKAHTAFYEEYGS